MTHEGIVRIASVSVDDAATAVRHVLAMLQPSSLAGILLFCSARFSLDELAAELSEHTKDLPVIGCTTAGEITPYGSVLGTITAVGFPSSDFRLQVTCFEDLDNFDPFAAQRTVGTLVAEAAANSSGIGPMLDRVALLLVDGLSRRQELIANTLQHILEDIPLIGGSAGDDMAYRKTHVLHDGRFQSDRAVLAVLCARRPLKVFRSYHHVAGSVFAVVTRADPAARTVHELNGERAAAEYARLVGVEECGLSEDIFAEYPLMVKVGGQYFSRSVQRIDKHGGLVFHSAIDRGLVLRLGGSAEIVSRLVENLHACDEQQNGIDAVLAFECALNRVEASKMGLSADLSDLYGAYRFVGFHSYGEQFRDIHLNRNLVGLAIGRRLLC